MQATLLLHKPNMKAAALLRIHLICINPTMPPTTDARYKPARLVSML
jgi:hypothetical protein